MKTKYVKNIFYKIKSLKLVFIMLLKYYNISLVYVSLINLTYINNSYVYK